MSCCRERLRGRRNEREVALNEEHIPSVKQRVRVMFVNRLPDGDVAAVRLDQVPIVGLELLNLFRRSNLVEAGAIRVWHVLNEF